MVKYTIDARRPKAEIEAVEVVRETELCIWLAPDPGFKRGRERRTAKKSAWAEYYDTWALAHAALSEKTHRLLLVARRDLQNAQGLDGNVRGMKEPQVIETGTDSTTT